MSVIRVGSTSTYADGWDAVFGGAKAGRGVKAGGRKKSRKAGATTAKRKTKAKPKAVKAARKGRRKQSARTKR